MNIGKETLTSPIPVIFSSCCLPILLTVKLVVAARRPPRTCSWDWALLLATELGSSADNVSSYRTVFWCAKWDVIVIFASLLVAGHITVKVWYGIILCNTAGATYSSRGKDRSCSCCAASSRCWQLRWGRCFYCYCAHTPASPHQGPETEKKWDWWKFHTRLSEGRVSYHLEGNVLWWTEFDTFIDKSVEVALADVGGNFGSKLGGYDGALHWTTLQRPKIARLTLTSE